jgi:hypothetical protein
MVCERFAEPSAAKRPGFPRRFTQNQAETPANPGQKRERAFSRLVRDASGDATGVCGNRRWGRFGRHLPVQKQRHSRTSLGDSVRISDTWRAVAIRPRYPHI